MTSTASTSTTPGPSDWVAALRKPHEHLRAVAAGLTTEQLTGQSYDAEWSVAQVLSHLGSGAEIYTLILESGLDGVEAPGPDQFHPIWDRWNAKSAVAMRDGALGADAGLVAGLEAVTRAGG